MHTPTDDIATIFALSSGQGRAGVAVIRISGRMSGIVLDRMAAPRPKPRFAGLRKLRHPETGEVLDEALALWFPSPRSETGEDMAELHVHGSGAVLRAVLSAIGTLTGCRPAEPGEFARRAFENGRIDLTAAEGLADLVDAETEAQRRQALAQAGGALARIYDGWRTALLEALALVEAAIDFSDEADVARDVITQAVRRVSPLAGEIVRHLANDNRGEIVRDGFRVVLAGAPNVGKSSLLNVLSQRDVAIVSPLSGTTRDVIEVRLDLAGYAVVLTDTAGLRDAASSIEQEGIRRTLARSREADLVLWVVDATVPVPDPPEELAERGGRARLLTVVNKIDAVKVSRGPAFAVASEAVQVSALTGEGLGDLVRRIADEVAARIGTNAAPPASQARHRDNLTACSEALNHFLAGDKAEAELRAEDLRIAADALGRITGRIGIEDVLGQIFGRFCIGK